MVAGGHKEGKEQKRARGVPSNAYTLTYQIDADVFRKILDSYPRFRSFVITRSLVRRSYFLKSLEDNVQVELLQRKLKQHRRLCEKYGMENDFEAAIDDVEDEEAGKQVKERVVQAA